MTSGQASPPGPDKPIAGRYRVEAVLGRGGMAVVYQAHDLVRDRSVALKRLLERDASAAHIASLFELEYHTLSQLVHPRIIEVFDYQSDDEGPFYTMELLTGGDLRRLAPLPWREACRLLCDVCSALALLHSRRLVHRDLTPLNVRCTPDGHAKVFDFGSMTQFGRAKHIVGTPPFVAPEALNGQSLDGQTDLFALGATAYFALTGRFAYPARTLAELPEAWSNAPLPPSRFVPEVPPILDELIMALLQQLPSARPSSAAEVMERLSAIGGFDIQEALLVSRSYLSTPTLVGRDSRVAAFERRLQRLASGQGGVIHVDGPAGSGRSRLLDACALQAKLSGRLVLRSDAQAAGLRRWGGVGVLLVQLQQQQPELSAELTLPHAALLTVVSMAASRRDSLYAVAPGERTSNIPSAGQPGRAEVQAALREILFAVAQRRELVLVVDDLDRLDEPSAAFVALLAHGVTERPMLIVSSAMTDAAQRGDQLALRLLVSVADEFHLRNLDALESEALILSLFGDVANVRWLADRVYDVTRGNPSQIMAVAQHLVQRGACNYAAGTWTLPSELDTDLLTAALHESIDPSLPERALDLARGLALSELAQVPLDECLQLSSHRNLKQLQEDIQALTAAGIANVDEDDVSFSRAGWRKVLLAGLSEERRRELHLRVAELFLQRSLSDLRSIQHLFLAGEVERSLDLLVANISATRIVRLRDPASAFEYLQSLPKNWAETYHALIDASRGLARPLSDRLGMQLELVAFATLAARYEGECTLEIARQLRHDAGLDLIAELADQVPPGELLERALGATQRRYDATPAHERGLPLLEALAALAQLTVQAIGMAGRTFDVEMLRAMPSLAPLIVLSPALAVVQKNLESTLAVLSGDTEPARRAYLEIAERVAQPDGAGLEGSHRFHVHAAALWAAGMVEVNLGRPVALERAAAIEHNPLFTLSAMRLRAMYALVRGDRASAEYYRSQTELHQIRNSPPQLFEGTQAMQATFGFAAIGDLLRVKQCLVGVEEMARQYAGWQPVAYAGRGAYQMLRGDYAQATREFELGLSTMSLGHPAWTYCAGSLIWALLRQEHLDEAVTRGRALFDAVQAEGKQLLSLPYLLVPLALAESSVGSHAAGVEHAETAIDSLSAHGAASVLLGEAYEVRARIAIHMADAAVFTQHAEACLAQYRIGGQAALLTRHDKLLRAARAAGLIETPASATSELDLRSLSASDVHTTVMLSLGTTVGAVRAERALHLLGSAMRSDSGFLYLMVDGAPTLVAQFGSPTPSLENDELVAQYVRESEMDEMTQVGVSTSVETGALSMARARSFSPVLLSHRSDPGTSVTAVALVSTTASGTRQPSSALLQALSRALIDVEHSIVQERVPTE